MNKISVVRLALLSPLLQTMNKHDCHCHYHCHCHCHCHGHCCHRSILHVHPLVTRPLQ